MSTDVDALLKLRTDILRRVRKLKAGKVVTYDPLTERAVVELGILGQAASGHLRKPTIIPTALVLWPEFAGMQIKGRLNPGDEVLIGILDHSLDRWSVAGGPVTADSDRAHELVDAVVILGLKSTANLQPGDPTQLTIGRTDGTAVVQLSIDGPGIVTIEGATIRLGLTAAAQHVALAEALHAYLVAMITASATGAADGGAAFKAALLVYLGANPPAGFASAKAVAE